MHIISSGICSITSFLFFFKVMDFHSTKLQLYVTVHRMGKTNCVAPC